MNRYEMKFQKEFVKALEAAGAFVFTVHGHQFQQAGIPDVLVWHKTWTGGIEFKYSTGKTTTIQRIQMRKLVERGTPCFVIRLRDDVVSFETHEEEYINHIEDWSSYKKDQELGQWMLMHLWDTSSVGPEQGPSN